MVSRQISGQISISGVSAGGRSKGRAVSLCSQVKERISRYGVCTILDEEILSVLSDVPVEKIKAFIEEYGEVGEICKNLDIIDVTDTQRKKLMMVFEFSKRAKYVGMEKVTLDSSQKAGSYVMDRLALRPVEEFLMVALNAQNKVIRAVTVSVGTVNETAVYVREIARKALLYNASSVVVGHNHPAGSLKPSQADINSTKNIKSALEVMNIKLVDHIIVNDVAFMSFAEQGIL